MHIRVHVYLQPVGKENNRVDAQYELQVPVVTHEISENSQTHVANSKPALVHDTRNHSLLRPDRLHDYNKQTNKIYVYHNCNQSGEHQQKNTV